MTSRAPCLILALGLLACDGAIQTEPASLETATFAIRNGTRDPQTIALTDGEMLAIGWMHSVGFPNEPYCTGTLIAGSVVLTAAHCLQAKAAEQIEFSVGALTDAPKGTFKVGQIFTHATLDMGVLYLVEDVRGQVPGIQPIQPNLTDLEGVADKILSAPGEVAGYGYTWDPNLGGRFFAALDITDINDQHVVVNGNGLQGLCQGDSGAPLLVPSASGAPVIIAIEERGEESCVGQDWMVRVDVAGDWLLPALGGEKKADSFTDPNAVATGVKQQNEAIRGCDQVPASAPLWALFGLLGLRRRERQ